MVRLIDATSLERLIRNRLKWHKSYSVEEILRDIRDAPTINPKDLHESCTEEAQQAH